MKNIARNSEIKSIIVDVSQRILEKNILNFTQTSLELNNITYTSKDTIYCNFLKHSNQYQIFVFENKFKYMIFELLDNKGLGFTLYIAKDFFVIFEDKNLYTYQKINQNYSRSELIDYIDKSFNISISTTIKLDEQEINEIIKNKDLDSNIAIFKNINIKSNRSFLLYLCYLFFCILGTFLYEEFEKKSHNKNILSKQKLVKNEYLKTIKKLKFNPYEKEYGKLIKTINKLELKLISLSYTSSIMKIKVHSKKKNNIYLFLNDYKSSLLSNSISKVNSKKLFESVLNVKIN